MAVICPTVTATDVKMYRSQLDGLIPFTKRLHIDLMDGVFAPSSSPGLDQIWWPEEMKADIHLMYQKPMECMEQLINLQPHMVIIHLEAETHHMDFAAKLHSANILAGLAILQDTPIEYAYQIMHSFDQMLVFSGHLGYHGGLADLELLEKVKKIRANHSEAEISWDGGITYDNALMIVKAGVDVLNVGSYIQQADNQAAAYAKLETVIRGN